MRTFQGKKAFVTGAASGIGLALARRLAAEGAALTLVDVESRKLNRVCDELSRSGVDVVGRKCDVSRPAEVDACVEATLAAWKGIDLLVNNAGICFYGGTDVTSQETWDRVLAINLRAPIRLTKKFLPTLKARPDTHVLNVASMYGLFATNHCAAYHTSKHGLVGFSKALRAETRRDGIGVTVLCPGFVDTGLFDAMDRRHDRPCRRPPQWMCSSADRVAKVALQAVRRDRCLALVSPLAHFAFFMERIFPGLIANSYGFGVRRRWTSTLPTGTPAARHINSAIVID